MVVRPTSDEAREQDTAQEAPNRHGALWKRSRSSVIASGRLAALLLADAWRLFLAVGVGMLFAVTLIASVPLYTDLVANVQLQAVLNEEHPAARNTEIIIPNHQLTAERADQEDRLVQPMASSYLSQIVQPEVTRYYSSERMLLIGVGPGNFPVVAFVNDPDIVTLQAFDYTQVATHMRLLAGSFPQPPQPGPPQPPDVLVSSEMAQFKGLQVGDLMVVSQFAGAASSPLPNDTGPGEVAGGKYRLVVRVSGIWTPTRADDPYWNGLSVTGASNAQGSIFPLMLDQQAFLQALAAFPTLETRQHWIYHTVPTRITTANMQDVAHRISALRGQLTTTLSGQGITGAEVLTALPQNIRDEQRQLGLLAQPLYVVVAQVVGLALLFVAAMAGLLVEREASEIAVLKSRGASGTQFVTSFAILGTLLGGLAAVAGPLLASGLAVLLIREFMPPDSLAAAAVGNAYLFDLASPQTAVLPAVAGGVLGVSAMLFAVQRAARLEIVAFRREQGRPTERTAWRRYYLDLQVALLCVLVYLDLSVFGGLGAREGLGIGSASPVLFAAPGLLLLAGALLVLRVFPFAAAAGVRFATRLRGATGLLAFAQLARSPRGPSRLTLLLALSVGLGLFGLTMNATIVRNAADRASYQAGSDLRLIQQGPELPVLDGRIQSRLRSLPGVQDVTPAFRDIVFLPSSVSSTGVAVLAVDPDSWQRVAGASSWRADYASVSLNAVMRGLRAHQWGASDADRSGATSAGDPGHPIWALVSQTFAAQAHVGLGDHFALQIANPNSTPASFIVGAIAQDFPTLYPTQAVGGFIVANLNDYLGAYLNALDVAGAQVGPNEYWLKTSSDAALRSSIANTLDQNAPYLDIARTVDRRDIERSILGNPLEAGVRGMLILGALAAVALAIIGTVVQSALAARQRIVQFAILRTFGLSANELIRMLLGEQLVVYVFGLIGGTLLAVVLGMATLPYLQFSDTTLDPALIGTPPYLLVVEPIALAFFYGSLVVAFACALALAAIYASRVGIGRTLHLGED